MEIPPGPLVARRRTGDEVLRSGGAPTTHSILDFWRWLSSDLASNTLRGVFAEYIVACDLGVADGTRTEWLPYDLVTRSGLRIEVKASAYIQTWHQARRSPIKFSIAPALGWDPATSKWGTEPRRHADFYVFCLLAHLDKTTLDPLDLDQWQFFVLRTTALAALPATRRSIGLASLLALEPAEAKFGAIGETIENLAAP